MCAYVKFKILRIAVNIKLFNKRNIRLILPGKILIKKEYEKLIFTDKINDIGEYNFEFIDEIVLPNGIIKIIND